MKADVYKLLIAQFLTAFADNAVLFTAVTMAMKSVTLQTWYVPALQASFLVAFVVLAPWVGPYADTHSKPRVLTIANIIKGIGAALMLSGFEPLLAYAIVGLGAAVYSPAKYGILPQLVDEGGLVKANGWIEGSTILAVLSGTVAGSVLANKSITLALGVIVALYIVSAMTALLINQTPVVVNEPIKALPRFGINCRKLLSTPRARFSTLRIGTAVVQTRTSSARRPRS